MADPASALEVDVGGEDAVATVVPATETRSTRPTRAGVAYPFKLKVEGEDEGGAWRRLNASTVTLDSVSLGDGDAAAVGDGLGGEIRVGEDGLGGGGRAERREDRLERPGVERFVTAREEL